MQTRVTVTIGQAFNSIPQNNIVSSVSGSWCPIGAAVPARHVRIQGVYWDATDVGAVLKIRDPQGGIWYHAVCMGGDVAVDILPTPITLQTPFEYYDDHGGNRIMLYGEYVR